MIRLHKVKNDHPNYGMVVGIEGSVVTLAGYGTSRDVGRVATRSILSRIYGCTPQTISPSTSIIPYIDSGVNTPKSPPAGGERLGCAPLIHQLVEYLRRQKRTQPEATSGITMVMSEVPKFQVGGAE